VGNRLGGSERATKEVFRVSVLLLIVIAGGLMSCIALVGSVTLLLRPATLDRIVLPLVAFSAGSLMGGAFFHMVPAAVGQGTDDASAYVWMVVGFTVFLCLEQFLHWHHCRNKFSEHHPRPLSALILIADGLHNLIGGLAVGGAFVADPRLGITAWLVAACHEIPQELGDFAVLIHGGLRRQWALLFNFLSALTFLAGSLLAYAASFRIEVGFLIPFAAGNFIYIAASDLVPEIKKHRGAGLDIVHFAAFTAGLLLLWALRGAS
jgi:zinc and cadmium transporter